MAGPSESKTTTHHDLPPYSVQTALVLAANTSEGCTLAHRNSFNNYRQITTVRIKILGMVDCRLD